MDHEWRVSLEVFAEGGPVATDNQLRLVLLSQTTCIGLVVAFVKIVFMHAGCGVPARLSIFVADLLLQG